MDFDIQEIRKNPDFLKTLSQFMGVLSNEYRLQILLILMNHPTHSGYNKYELNKKLKSQYNTKLDHANLSKHLVELFKYRLVSKYIAPGGEHGQNLAYYKYILGSLDTMIHCLHIFNEDEISLKTTSFDKIVERNASVNNFIYNVFQETALYLMDGERIERTYPLLWRMYEIGKISTQKDDVWISREDNSVSKKHAKIWFSSGSYIIKDINSTNGTWIWSEDKEIFEKISPNTDYMLKDGTIIRLGTQNTILVFHNCKEWEYCFFEGKLEFKDGIATIYDSITERNKELFLHNFYIKKLILEHVRTTIDKISSISIAIYYGTNTEPMVKSSLEKFLVLKSRDTEDLEKENTPSSLSDRKSSLFNFSIDLPNLPLNEREKLVIKILDPQENLTIKGKRNRISDLILLHAVIGIKDE